MMLDFLYIILGFIWFAGMVGTVVALYVSCLLGTSIKKYISCVKGESDE